MANWCSNTVTFAGKTENIKALLMSIYIELKKRVNEEHGFKINDGDQKYCFYASCQNLDLRELNSEIINNFSDNEFNLSYETKWSPNLQETHNAAMLFNLDLTHGYEELSMGIYGENKYCTETKKYSIKELTDADIENCSDEDGISDYEKLEDIFNQKKYIEINV